MSDKAIYVTGLLLGSIITQTAAIFLLPMTRTSSSALPLIGMMISFALFSYFMSLLVSSGLNLTLLVPLLAAAGPLAGIGIGVLVYGEPASAAKISALLTACGLVVLANFL